jgi:5-methylcytosine-specific restriction endonuclease McrA
VRLRVFERHGGICHLSGRKIRAGEAWDCDHVIALCNGGSHSESNLAPALRDKHREKTAQDVKERAKVDRIRKRALGMAKPKGRPMPGSKASGLRKRMDGTVERR